MQTCLVTGAAGFIGSYLCKRLKEDGYYVVGADWKKNEFMEENEYCDKFYLTDLRELANCKKVVEDVEWVFHLAADMGGMGFIQSNHSTILYNNTMISFNVMEAVRQHGKCTRFFYASSACVYPEHLQTETDIEALREDTAWPAQPQDAYGLEKIVSD